MTTAGLMEDGQNDQLLLALIAEQRHEALEALHHRYSAAVFGLAISVLRDSVLAEDVAQDVFLKVWLRPRSYRAQRGSVETWLLSIAHHRTIDVWRRRRIERSPVYQRISLSYNPLSDSYDPVEYVTRQFERNRIEVALRTLPPEQNQVVRLAYFGEMTQQEIANLRGTPLGTVKTRMRLGLRKLRRALEVHAEEHHRHSRSLIQEHIA